jgi:two-component sensor histidine kinase
VSYRVGEREAALTVEDDGIGGAEADAAAGTGIGGMLMSAFARQVHGELDEEKSSAGGRLVRIRMPRTNGGADEQPAASQAVPAK